MLRTFLSLLFLIILLSSAKSQEWQQEFPLPTHHEFKDINTANNWTWVVGEQGSVFATADNGSNWGQLPTPTTENLNGVYFVDEQSGWIVGDNSTILHTTNGGNTWQPQNAPVGLILEKVQFIDGNRGWLMDRSGQVLRTTNAGAIWLPATIPSATNLTDFIFIDANIGWVIGNSAVWKTTDGGDSWSAQILSTTFPTQSIHFIDANYGWIGTDNGNVHKTIDGGASWIASTIPIANNYPIKDIHFKDNLNGMLLRTNIILNTTDGGANWSFFAGGYFDKLYFSDTSNGYAIGGFNSIQDLAITTDGGQTFNTIFRTSNQPFRDVVAINKNELWAVGEAGNYNSIDGGHTWLNKGSNLTPCYEVEFADNGLDGWMITTWLRIYSTHDGGLTWTRSSSIGQGVITEQLHELIFIDNLHGWVGSSYGTIYKTIDGGISWTTTSTGSLETKVLEFSTTQIGWKGTTGGFYKTSNAGTNWQIDAAFSGRTVQDMQFLDASNGWAVGTMNGQAFVMSSFDGGTTWNTYSVSSVPSFNRIAFADNQHGWATDNNGAIWYSNDGGQNWLAQPHSVNQVSNALATSDSTHCWAVGNKSTILRYQDCSVGRPIISESGGILSIPANFQTYQWYFNGDPIIGATQATYTATNEGLYAVLITGPGDCQTTSYSIVMNNIVVPTQLIEESLEQTFVLFPNPSQGVFSLNFEASNLPKILLVQDISGRILQSIQTSEIKSEMQLNMSFLANGLYFITAKTATAVHSQKVMIQH